MQGAALTTRAHFGGLGPHLATQGNPGTIFHWNSDSKASPQTSRVSDAVRRVRVQREGCQGRLCTEITPSVSPTALLRLRGEAKGRR